jgi:hypothetical protein
MGILTDFQLDSCSSIAEKAILECFLIPGGFLLALAEGMHKFEIADMVCVYVCVCVCVSTVKRASFYIYVHFFSSWVWSRPLAR